MQFALVACVALTALVGVVNSVPRAGLLSGIFTFRGNNPAFKCNKVSTDGGTVENVVIETRINKFKNEDDDLYHGSDCEVLPFDDCDVRVQAAIDTTSPTDNWPDTPFTELVNEWDDNDVTPNYQNQYAVGNKKHAYTACKVVPKLSIATIRVNLEDVDSGVRNDVINHFNCHWAPTADAVAASRSEAQWQTIPCCTAFQRDMKSTVKHELKMDVRVYKNTDDSCPAGEGRFP